MENDEMNFDNQLPSDETIKDVDNEAPAEKTANPKEKTSLKDMANSCSLVGYEFVKALKREGHTSIADLIFKEFMTIACASNLSSEAIGKNRFYELLETGYYSSGRLLVYLEFCKSIGVEKNIREALVESVTGIHKILAASIKTVRANATKASKEKVQI